MNLITRREIRKSIKRLFITLSFVALSFAFCNVAAAQTANKNASQIERDRQELIRLDREIGEASNRKDAATLERLIADDFIFTAVNGKTFDKKRTIAYWAKANPKAPDETCASSDERVRVFGTTAVVVALDICQTNDKDGERTVNQSAFTDVWEKRNGRWLLVAEIGSPVKPQTTNISTIQSAEEQKLRDLRNRLDKAFELKDADTQASFFAADGIFLAGGPQPFEGRAAYRESLLRVFQRPNILLTHETAKIEVSASGEIAYELGSWTESWNEPDGLTTLTGRYFAAWKKVGGVWQVAAQTLKTYNCVGGSYCKK